MDKHTHKHSHIHAHTNIRPQFDQYVRIAMLFAHNTKMLIEIGIPLDAKPGLTNLGRFFIWSSTMGNLQTGVNESGVDIKIC